MSFSSANLELCLVQNGYPLCDFSEYDYGPKSYLFKSTNKKGKEKVKYVAPERKCRCGVAVNYGLVPSELGIGYYCRHMIGDDLVGFLVMVNNVEDIVTTNVGL